MANSARSRKNHTSRVGTKDTERRKGFSGSSIPSVRSTRRALSFIGGILFGTLLIFWLAFDFRQLEVKWWWSSTPAEEWKQRREQVKDAFVSSWDAYTRYAWGQDRFHPVSKSGSQMSPKGLGWIIVDSLDTMMIMNLTSQLSDARIWLQRKLDYEQDQDVNTFETTIRMLGGLLSAHYLSRILYGVSSRRDRVYLSKAVDLADRLLGAYDSPSGIPYASIHLATRKGLVSHADGGAS